jgi:hypothetical protein
MSDHSSAAELKFRGRANDRAEARCLLSCRSTPLSARRRLPPPGVATQRVDPACRRFHPHVHHQRHQLGL